ncbi:MAG: YfiR family protein [Bacteroidales bacterium]|nr:YfiR family protein [Bacteroidales bacterium]
MSKKILTYGFIVILMIIGLKVRAQQFTEYDLKAAYVYNFSKFVKWPDQAFSNDTSKFVITIIGESPITPVLFQALKNKKVMNRSIKIQVIDRVEDIGKTHILFVSKDMQTQITNIIKVTEHKPILVVGDIIEGFCQNGGIINFTQKSSKYRFEINNISAQNAGLKISSKLLALARIISSEEIKF